MSKKNKENIDNIYLVSDIIHAYVEMLIYGLMRVYKQIIWDTYCINNN